MKVVLISFVLLNCLLFVSAFPPFSPNFPFDSDDFDFKFPDIPDLNISAVCSRLGCDSSATSCNKKISTSEDKETLIEEVKCFGANGNELSSTTNSKPNPLPGSIQNGFEYFGGSSSGTQTINVNGNQHTTNLDNVETFNK